MTLSKLKPVFDNQWFWVCGASSGIGFAVARELARLGAHLYLMSRSEKNLQDAKAVLSEESASQIVIVPMDIADPWLPRHVGEFLGEKKIRGLLLNGGGPHGASASSITREDRNKAHDLLLSGPLTLLAGLLPHLQSPGGSIVALTSTTVKEPNRNLVLSSMYRTALTVYLKHLSDELGPQGIRVNQVAPGFTSTERLKELASHVAAVQEGEASEQTIKHVEAAWKNVAALKRMASPDEIASVCRFLFSDDSSFVTGQTLVADGGKVRAY